MTRCGGSERFFHSPCSNSSGLIEWRAILAGEGPNQTTPWFNLRPKSHCSQ